MSDDLKPCPVETGYENHTGQLSGVDAPHVKRNCAACPNRKPCDKCDATEEAAAGIVQELGAWQAAFGTICLDTAKGMLAAKDAEIARLHAENTREYKKSVAELERLTTCVASWAKGASDRDDRLQRIRNRLTNVVKMYDTGARDPWAMAELMRLTLEMEWD